MRKEEPGNEQEGPQILHQGRGGSSKTPNSSIETSNQLSKVTVPRCAERGCEGTERQLGLSTVHRLLSKKLNEHGKEIRTM